ncbi:MAG: 3-dehydroquinate synthase family protein [Bdellovibrionota bacterium]
MNQIESLKQSEIRIDWSMSSPGLLPQTWRAFDSAEHPANAARTRVEEELKWPAGTIRALDFAFEHRLSRTMGWDLKALPDKAALQMAAKVFRRGVVTSEESPRTLSGSYAITFSNHSDPRADLNADAIHILDQNVSILWGITPRADDLVLQLSEKEKTLETVAKISQHLAGTNKPVQIIGGGILADTAAFAASLAGRSFELIPTTLLAMADACVGGKTGVNFGKHGKNQLGLFAFPSRVIIHAGWLKTLPTCEIKAGLAESYKHAVISRDKTFSRSLSELEPTAEAIKPWLHRIISVKAEIIQIDPNEVGLRAVLNFGHTLAHALETISQTHNPIDPLLHGEAISIGMRFACYLSFTEGYLKAAEHEHLQSELKNAKFMISNKDFQTRLGPTNNLWPQIRAGIFQDKKNVGSAQTTEWVLLKNFGEFVQTGSLYTVAVHEDQIKKSWETFAAQESLLQN